MTNAEVAQAWREGKTGHSMNMRTDGKDVFSYALKIGTTKKGAKIAYDYWAPFTVSMTTSHHVSRLAGAGVVFVDPGKTVSVVKIGGRNA